MRTHCYEIGGDVFSLAELECCVIRGSMTKPTYYKAPFVREPKKSRTHYMYALEIVDPRINFVLVRTCTIFLALYISFFCMEASKHNFIVDFDSSFWNRILVIHQNQDKCPFYHLIL
jgi:hypothetical protein